MHELEAEYWGKVDFVYIDYDNKNNRDFMEKYSVNFRPEFILVKPDGTVIQHWRGAPIAQVQEAIDNYLATGG